MHILISNDDGYNAPGLLVVSDALKNQHHKITIVAPRDNVSGCGMSLSLNKQVRVEQTEESRYVVDGSSADCIQLGLTQLVTEPVDLVISGINSGATLADDIFYSGTFGAAMEARRLGMPSISLSVNGSSAQHFQTAAYVAVKMCNAMPHLDYRSLVAVLNVNVPDIPVADLRGLRATVLGERLAPSAPTEKSNDGKDDEYTLYSAGDFRRTKRSKMQDFEAIEQGFASITPLSARLDDSAFVDDVQIWLDNL